MWADYCGKSAACFASAHTKRQTSVNFPVVAADKKSPAQRPGETSC